MNNKLIAVFLIFVIVSITPASAIEYADIQNDIDSIKYSQEHFGFFQCFKVMGKVFTLMKHVKQIDIYPLIKASKGMREEVKIKDKNKQLERTTLLKYLKDKDRIEKTNQINPLNTKKSFHDIKQINKFKPPIKETNQINGTENSTKEYNQVNNTQNSTKNSNQIQSTDNKTQINNITKVKADIVEAPDQAVKHANDIKSKLNERGLHVKIRYSPGSIDELKSKDIVQLIETSHGYIKYWIFKGINENATDNKVVSLYNGKTDVNISLSLFKRAFTGIIMNLDGEHMVKMVPIWWGKSIKVYRPVKQDKSLNKAGEEKTKNEDVTEYDVVDEIFKIQKRSLENSINNSGRMKTIAGLLKGIGIGLTIIASIIAGIAAVFAAMPEPVITKLAAVVIAIITVIVFGIATASYFTGLCWETDILFAESVEKSELANLESREL
jgi:hypothetical protein